MITVLNKILNEWAFRTKSGKPNPKSMSHQIILENILKEFGWNQKARIELLNSPSFLIEKDIVKNKKSGNTYVVQKHNPDTQSLIQKDASEDDIAKVTKAKVDKEKSDKKADDELGSSDEEFAKKNKSNQTKTKYSLPENVGVDTKYPKKYTKLLTRMLNTNVNVDDNTAELDYFIGAGGKGLGGSEANIGELMTLMSTTMRSEEANNFFNSIEEHLAKVKRDGQKTHVGEKWLKAAKENRKVSLRMFRDKYGNGYQIEDAAWDVREEVEAMGMNYDEKGFSTDVYFKVKDPEGSSNFAEISLKQSLAANLHNGTVRATFSGKYSLPDDVSDDKYSDNQIENNDNYYKQNQQNVQSFITDVDFDERFDEIASKVASDMSIKTREADAIAKNFKEMITQSKEDLLSNPELEIDRDYIGNITQEGGKTKGGFTGARKAGLKPLVVLARVMSEYGDEGAKDFMEGQKKLNSDYNLRLAKHIGEEPEAKEAVLNTIKEKLPLKSVADGEEDIVLGETALTQKTLRLVFGTDDWNEIKENLIVDTSDEKNPTISYVGRVREKDVSIPISNLVIREDGIGYKGAHKFDMKLDSKFGKRIKSASSEIYGDQETFDSPVGGMKGREPV